MSNYKIVENPNVVPEGVSVSETSKNGDSIIGVYYESTMKLIPLWYEPSYFWNSFIEVYFIDPTTMELYSDCEVAKEFIPVVERDIKAANAVTVMSSLVQRVIEVQCMQLHSTQYSVLTQRLRTGSKSGTAASHWGKREGIHSVCHCLSDDISLTHILPLLPFSMYYLIT